MTDDRLAPADAPQRPLTTFAWLSVGAAVVTITLKSIAYLLTGSVGLLSDAAESVVNLVAAFVALAALTVSARPPDLRHHFGRGKAEYVAAAAEGLMILGAAALIIVAAVRRFLDLRELQRVDVGLAVTVLATLVNLGVAIVLLRAGRENRSAALVADGRHLMTDVWTSVGVVAAVLAVALTGWLWLDPLIAVLVALNIVVTGGRLVARSTSGLLDAALSPEEHEQIAAVLRRFSTDEVEFHALQTRSAGRSRFVSVHVLVPGAWTVQRGHDLLEEVEHAIRAELPGSIVHTHLEPVEDERSHVDAHLGHPLESRGRAR